jgi:serine/threonine protein kinase
LGAHVLQPQDVSLFSLIVEAVRIENSGAEVSFSDKQANGMAHWIAVRHGSGVSISQGWKLHVSAGLCSAATILSEVLPILLRAKIDFKVSSSLDALASLNDGTGGLSQIGKFITIYPDSDAEALRIATMLDRATFGMRGPAIPSDRPLRKGSLVHYRYGSFDSATMQLPTGEVCSSIRRPDGVLVADRREGAFTPPDWAADPFAAAGFGEVPIESKLINGRYVCVANLDESPRGSIHIAVDVIEPRRCILKRARRDSLLGSDGRDARTGLRNEAAFLRQVDGESQFPRFYDLFEDNGDLLLAMEDIDGETIEEAVGTLSARGELVPADKVIRWGIALADALGLLHRKGFVHRDVKPSNVMIDDLGAIRLIDFELCHQIGSDEKPYGLGTIGYIPAPRERVGAPAISDDIYGLGALLFFVLSGVDPSSISEPLATSLARRPLQLLNPNIDTALEKILLQCLAPDQGPRFDSMRDIREALSNLPRKEACLASDENSCVQNSSADRTRFLEFASELCATLCANAVVDGNTATWLSSHEPGSDVKFQDLGVGAAGPVLALADLAAILRLGNSQEILAKGAHALRNADRPSANVLPGLYVGEAGIGVALLRAGQVLNDDSLLDFAAAHGHFVASLPHKSPDLYNGTAGRLKFHLFLWKVLSDPNHLRDAIAAGEYLLQTVVTNSDNEGYWRIPEGYGGMSGEAYLGFAHGAAGIADALLDLWEETGDERFLASVQSASHWLSRQAIPALADGSGLNWPDTEGGGLSGAFWCHGAAGIGGFLIHAARFPSLFPGTNDMAARAASTVSEGMRWLGSTRCHGLSGNIEFLLDMYQSTGENRYLAKADKLAELLVGQSLRKHGLLYWPSESPETLTPDYMVGYAGTAVCFLRLAFPASLPSQLSCENFARVPRSEEFLVSATTSRDVSLTSRYQ